MADRNLTLLTDLYELTMMQGYYKNKEENKLIEEKWVMPEEIPYGDSDIMFFQ